jgi:hypothetical protein
MIEQPRADRSTVLRDLLPRLLHRIAGTPRRVDDVLLERGAPRAAG